jgi:hypothetical protein
MAAALARRLGVPHVELDGLKHQPGWTELSRDEFAARVRTAIAATAGSSTGTTARSGMRFGTGPTPWSGSTRLARS